MRRISVYFFALSFCISLFSSCTLKPKDQVTLFLDLSPIKNKALGTKVDFRNSLGGVSGGSPGILNFPSPTLVPAPPSVLSSFTCFAINVSGPGIPPMPGSVHAGDPPPEVSYAHAVQGGVADGYPGIVSTPILFTAGSQTIQLDVPAGPGRLIQLVGMVSSVANDPIDNFCNHGGPLPVGNGSGDGYFEVGRAFVPSAFNDLSVTLTDDYTGKRAWYQEFKRIKSQDNCKPFAAQYFASGGSITSAQDTFYFSLATSNSSIWAFPMKMNNIQAEVTTANSIVLGAKLYLGYSGALPYPLTGGIDATNTVSLVAAGTYQVSFNFPMTNVAPDANDARIAIYRISGGATFQLECEAGGTQPEPIGTVGFYSSGWQNVSGQRPHVMIGQCFN